MRAVKRKEVLVRRGRTATVVKAERSGGRPSVTGFEARKTLRSGGGGGASTTTTTTRRRNLLAGFLALSVVPTACEARAEGVDADRVEGGLRRSGANGLLAEEEERLIQLRMTAEGNAKRLDSEAKLEIERAIERARAEGEAEARKSFERTNSLCATPYGIDIVGITEGIALAGALVGGISAKKRKDEVQKLNDQLRTINVTLRKQARSGIVYAPDMNYAPASTGEPAAASASATVQKSGDEASRVEDAVSVSDNVAEAEPEDVTTAVEATAGAAAPDAPPSGEGISETGLALRNGRKLLEVSKGAAALVHFEKARMLSRSAGNKVQERRAERGLAAASRMQKQFKKAIGHLERVLEISKEMDEYTGDADAYGVIADIYTELGDLEKAAKFYDLYLKNIDLS